MENPEDNRVSKRFRWVGQPSEAELLGLPAPTRRHNVSFLPRQIPAPAPVAPPNEVRPRRRIRVRDGVTVAAVGVAIWFALQGAGTGLPFHGSSPAAPQAVGFAAGDITLDRHELQALPRYGDRSGSLTRPDSRTAGERSSSGSKTKTDPTSSPPGGTKPDDPAKPPLVQATIPGVGSVTVEQPDLSPLGGTPTLPDAGDVLPETPTLPVP